MSETPSNFTIDDGEKLTIRMEKPCVIHPRAIEVLLNGNVIGIVSATYDFSELPERYHEDALHMISVGTRLHVTH